jgi:hypothetical protein
VGQVVGDHRDPIPILRVEGEDLISRRPLLHEVHPLRPSAAPRRSRLARTAIRASDLLIRTGLVSVELDPQSLIREARRRTGLEDLGDGFSSQGLERLLHAYESEARLHAIGRIAARRDIVSLLSNRMQVVEDARRHPGIAQQEIRHPVFIVGLPRTGTTFLHRLLAQDPAHRAPRTWEILRPDFPREETPRRRSARIARTDRELRQLDRLAPAFRRIHLVGADLPEECIAIMAHGFVSDRFPAMFRLPSYRAWLDRQDLRPAYEDHRRFLQHLQWRRGGRRWLLKAPAHLLALDDLLAVYPDAWIVQTHRDPVRVLASLASLIATLHGAFSDLVDPAEIGRDVSARWAEALRRSIEVRAHAREDRFVDVHYQQLLRDPMAVVRRLYERMGETLAPDVERSMQRFVAENRPNRFGRHRYRLSSFALDADTERRRFARYREHFRVVDEMEETRSGEGGRHSLVSSRSRATPAGSP